MAALAALVKITRSNGTTMRFPTDEHWEASLEKTSNWQPAHVVADLTDKRLGDPGELPQPAAYLRRTLALSKNVQSARLYVTALGSYRVFLNGSRVGSDVLTPDFTDYRKRVLYQAYDVTSLLANGNNVISALLGDGWYGSGLTWVGMHFFPPPDRFVAQLELDYADGSHDTVVTDESWKAAASPILRSDIYGGEVYDARLEQAGWEKPGFDDSKWKPAVVADAPAIAVSSQITAPARVIATLEPKSVTPVANGAYIFDMGQNMVGWATLKVKGTAGTKVRLRFAEILNPDGTIYTANLRNADATDVYILRGGDEETFCPAFYFPRFSLRRGDGLSRNAASRCDQGRCRQQRERRSCRQAGDLKRPGQSNVVDRHLGSARKFPEHPHGLSAARRTPGLDGRRRSFLANRKLQLRHRGVLAEIHPGHRRCSNQRRARLPMFLRIRFLRAETEPKARPRGTKAWSEHPAGAMRE